MRVCRIGKTKGGTWIWIAAALYLIAATAALRAEDLPKFKQGMWRFQRTIQGSGGAKPQTIDTSKCVDPNADMKKQNEMLTKAGCKFSPATRSGNTYTFIADCEIQGVKGRSKSVITVESDTAYTIDVESQSGTTTTKERLLAKRTGDCPR